MTRVDYYDDQNAPAPNSIVAAASAIVANEDGEVLLHRRTDNNLWALPGGGMEFGESVTETIIREVQEETGLEVRPTHVVAVYSDPKHVFAYSDGEVRQEFSVCIECKVVGGSLRISDESQEIRFVTRHEVVDLDMHPRIRARVLDYYAGVVGGLNP